MKKAFLVILLVTFSSIIDAQKYSPLNQEQLNLALIKAKNRVKTGKVFTFIGLAADIVGTVIYSDGKAEYEPGFMDFGMNNKMANGGAIIAGGTILLAIGVPTWLYWDSNRRQIELELKKFKGSASMYGIVLRINF